MRCHVSPTYTELHTSRTSKLINNARTEGSGHRVFYFYKVLVLKEENTSLILKLLQYLLINLRTLRWAKLEKGRYGSLEYRVSLFSGGAEVLHYRSKSVRTIR